MSKISFIYKRYRSYAKRGKRQYDKCFQETIRQKNEISAVAEKGSIVAFNLNTWHAGAKNINGKPRKTIFMQIKKRDQEQLLNYKKYLSKETKKKLNECQKYLLSIRDIDPTQKEDSVSITNSYMKQFGKDRI